MINPEDLQNGMVRPDDLLNRRPRPVPIEEQTEDDRAPGAPPSTPVPDETPTEADE